MIRLNILAIAAVEDRTNLDIQIAKQTLQPNNVFVHIDKNPAQGINDRRKRIAENHKILVQAVEDLKPDLVWQLEGDSVLNHDTLQKLYDDFQILKGNGFGYVSGREIGRHGLYCLGAWNVADDRKSFESLDYKEDKLVNVDATGFYCLLSQPKVWLSGECSWNGEGWGPDVNFGLSLKKQGYKIYVDPKIAVGHEVTHRNGTRGVISVENSYMCNAKFTLVDGRWTYKTYE